MKANLNFRFLKIVKIIILCGLVFIPSFPSYGHLYGFNYQEWENQRNNIRVQFDISPSTPTMGKNSTMIFSVQNLKTGEHLKDFKETIAVRNSEDTSTSNGLIHKFETTAIHDMDFLQNFIFPNGGTYYIWLRIDTPNGVITMAEFTVFVSSPQFQFLNMSFIIFPVIIVIVIFATILITVAYHIYKKNNLT